MLLSRKLTIVVYSILSTVVVHASCDPEYIRDGKNISLVTQSCIQTAKANNRHWLPLFVSEKSMHCELFAQGKDLSDPSRIACHKKVLRFAKEVLSCNSQIKRYQQAIEHDIHASEKRFEGIKIISPTDAMKSVFDKVTKTADAIIPAKFKKPNWNLKINIDEIKNASAGVGGMIFASSGLIDKKSPFTADEVTAILAHEAAHVVLEHGLEQACLAYEWVGQIDLTLHEAKIIFEEDLREAGIRKDDWSRLSQENEKEADSLAVKILKKMSVEPKSMLTVIEKLLPKEENGFASGSHPTREDRIQNIMGTLKEIE